MSANDAVVPLSHAYLCMDCETISQQSEKCPKCLGSSLINLANVLGHVKGETAKVIEEPDAEEIISRQYFVDHC